MFDLFSDWGGPIGWAIILLVGYYGFGTRWGSRFALVALIAGATNTWLKWLIFEPRPYYVSDAVSVLQITPGLGMPSGHAQGVAAVWALLAVDIRRWWMTLGAVVVIVMTGLSRVYYGVHSANQVLLGWTLGLAVVGAVVAASPRVADRWRDLSTVDRWLFFVVVSVLVVAVTLVLAGFRVDQPVPADWAARFTAAIVRLGEMVEGVSEPLVLVDPSNAGLAGALIGVVGIAGFTEAVEVRKFWHVGANVLIGVAAISGFIMLVQWLAPEHALAFTALGVLFAWLCLWAPVRVVHTLDARVAG